MIIHNRLEEKEKDKEIHNTYDDLNHLISLQNNCSDLKGLIELAILTPDDYYIVKKLQHRIREESNTQDSIVSPIKSLIISEKMLEVNVKSYTGWHFRAWIILEYYYKLMEREEYNNPKVHNRIDNKELNYLRSYSKREVSLIRQLLSHDKRNFHCWKYLLLTGRDLKKEALFCLKRDVSNYSALHHYSGEKEEEEMEFNIKSKGYSNKGDNLFKHAFFVMENEGMFYKSKGKLFTIRIEEKKERANAVLLSVIFNELFNGKVIVDDKEYKIKNELIKKINVEGEKIILGVENESVHFQGYLESANCPVSKDFNIFDDNNLIIKYKNNLVFDKNNNLLNKYLLLFLTVRIDKRHRQVIIDELCKIDGKRKNFYKEIDWYEVNDYELLESRIDVLRSN